MEELSLEQLFTLDFQRQVLHLLASNVLFSAQYGDLLKEEYFETNSIRIVYQIIKDYSLVYEKELDLSHVQVKIQDTATRHGYSGETIRELNFEAKSVFSTHIKSEQFLIDHLIKFARRQELKNALVKAVDILEKDGSPERVLSLIDRAVSTGSGVEEGINFGDLADLPRRYKEKYSPEKLITSGIPSFDAALFGGFAPEEVHTFIAAPKTGKSTLGVSIGAANLRKGKTVYHISLELKKEDVGMKYATNLSYLTLDQICNLDDETYAHKMARYEDKKPKLFINNWPEGSINALQVRGWISRMRAKTGLSPDLIIVDYDDPLIGDTKVSMLDGTERRIDSLVGEEEFWVYACKEDGTVVPGRGHSARVARHVDELIEITLDNGEVIKSTINHNHLLRNGTYKRADEFVVGDSLMPLYRTAEENTNKFVSGREQVLCNKTGKYKLTHRVVAEYFNGDIGSGYHVHHKDKNPLNNAPSNLEVLTHGEHTKIHWDDKRYCEAPVNHKVVSVRKITLEEPVPVYCLTVDKYHNYALSAGIFTHNCLLPTSGKTDSTYSDGSQVFTDLINLAAYFKCPIITFSQPQREAWALPNEGKIICSHHLAHSARKAHKCYSVSSLNFEDEKKTGILWVDMNRRGESKVKIRIERDLARAHFTENK